MSRTRVINNSVPFGAMTEVTEEITGERTSDNSPLGTVVNLASSVQ
ncbi:hypothetical protein [Nostoc sp.]